jgi:hypothetical protein
MDSRCFRNQKTWSLCIRISTNSSFYLLKFRDMMTFVYFQIQPIISTFYLHTKTKPSMTINHRKKNYVHFVDHRTPLLLLKLGSNCALLSYCRYKNIYLFYIHCLNCLILYIGCAYNARKIQQILLFLNYHIVV